MALTEQELQAREAQLNQVEIILRWRARHQNDYVANETNSNALAQYLQSYNLPLTELNLEQAFVALRARGFKFTSGGTTAGTDRDGLPTVPAYMAHIKTKADIRNLDAKTFRQYSTGPDASAFQAHIKAIQERGRG